MENVRKHRDIKLVTTDKRRNQLVSEPNYHTKNSFSGNLMAIEMKKTKVKMNKPVYLGMPILVIRKTLMYEFWYDFTKPKYRWNCIQRSFAQPSCTQYNGKLYYMDTDNFIIHIKTLLMMLDNSLTHLIMMGIFNGW